MNQSLARRNALADEAGFNLLELMFVIVIIGIISAIAIPQTRNALRNYRLIAATKAVSGAISSARYQSIMHGYKYNITFAQGSRNYQVGAKIPPNNTFTNVGNPVPWSADYSLSMAPDTVLEFSPGGTVGVTTGSMSFTVTNGSSTETITISEVGNVSVTP